MLRLENVRKSYIEGNGQRLPVLDIAELSVEAGEQVVLLGPSGCGKTTLLHVIAGISQADEGKIELGGVDVGRLSESVRDRFRATHLGYVFQTFNLLSGFTALENVMLGMTFARSRRDTKRARELLAKVGLEHRLHHKPTALSVGEQQRVAVARALANRPSLLLADEPTANVDPANQQIIIDLIRQRCQEEKVAMILVTHAMEVAEQFGRQERLDQINRVVAESPLGAQGDKAR